MNNTIRSINFAIAFMAVISIVTFILPTIDFDAFGENIEIIFPNILFLLFVIVFSIFQFLFRLILTSKFYIKDKIFFHIDMKKSIIYSRMVSYIVVMFIFFWPVIASRNWSFITPTVLLNLLSWILIVEILIFISYKYTKIYFLTDGILIKGLDFRIDIPLNDRMLSLSGFYPYYNIQSYTIHNNYLKLELYNCSGEIEGYLTTEKIKPVAAFLESKGIKYKAKNEL